MEHQNNKPQDFVGTGDNYLKKVDYDAKTAEINNRLTELESKIKDNDSFAATFNEAFDHSKKLDATILAAVVNLIQTNTDVKSAVTESVKSVDREWQKSATRRVGFAIWTLLVSLISGAIVFFLARS